MTTTTDMPNAGQILEKLGILTTPKERADIAVLYAMKKCRDRIPRWDKWAEAWLSGEDTTKESAHAASGAAADMWVKSRKDTLQAVYAAQYAAWVSELMRAEAVVQQSEASALPPTDEAEWLAIASQRLTNNA